MNPSALLICSGIIFTYAGCIQFADKKDEIIKKVQGNGDLRLPIPDGPGNSKVAEVNTKQVAIILPEKDLESIIFLTSKLCKYIMEKATMCGIGRSIMGFETNKDGKEELQTFYVVYSYIPAKEFTDDYAKSFNKVVQQSFNTTYIDYLILDYDGKSQMFVRSK